MKALFATRSVLVTMFLVMSILSPFSVLAGTKAESARATAFDPQAASFSGFIKVAPKRELFVDYVKAQDGQPTVILINGLTYSTTQWEQMVLPLLKRGVGVLRFDPFGMGQTLLKYAPISEVITYGDQIKDLKTLLTTMEIPAPYNLVGLSYGGGIALGYAVQYPEDIKNIIALAPYTERLQDQAAWIYQQIKITRATFPLNPASDTDLYNYFLRQLIYLTYPSAEPIVLENPYKLEATYRLVQGITPFVPLNFAKDLPPHSLHLMIAREDQYIKPEVLEKFWDAVPLSARASRIFVNNTEHKMPEAIPNFTAAWIYQVISENPLYRRGLDFEGYPLKGEVKQGHSVIRLGAK